MWGFTTKGLGQNNLISKVTVLAELNPKIYCYGNNLGLSFAVLPMQRLVDSSLLCLNFFYDKDYYTI